MQPPTSHPATPVEEWPPLPYPDWKPTCDTLHLWTQIVGKVRLARTPWTNHSWHVPLYLTSRGLTTSPIPHGSRTFEIDFDFVDHRLLVRAGDCPVEAMPLRAQAVADFYADLLGLLDRMGLPVTITPTPNEIPDCIPFDLDRTHTSYDREQVGRFWRALSSADRVLKRFRAGFVGKCSPVHFFWGSFDLAVTRFSGRRAPEHPGGVPNLPDWVAREAYSHEVSSCGFWPGGPQRPQALFYAYAYPEPAGFQSAPVNPPAAEYDTTLGEYVLPYDAVRGAASPEEMLLGFLQSTYEAAAVNGGWDRAALEWSPDAA